MVVIHRKFGSIEMSRTTAEIKKNVDLKILIFFLTKKNGN
jgi:hypothetical protein